jgi:hypothetical protein
MSDIDKLIRAARPAIDEGAGRRAVARIAPGFVTPATPTPWLRLAAAIVIAAAAGFGVSAWMAGASEPAQDPLAEVEASLSHIDSRLDAMPGLTEAELQELEQKTQRLERMAMPLDELLRVSVEEVAQERHLQRMEEQRERHLSYVRNRYERDVNRSMARFKREYRLTPEKENELLQIFAKHGEQMEQLISRNYRGKTRSLRGEFAEIKKVTNARVETLLSEVPASLPGGDLAEWGPNPDYETQSDYESFQRWSEQAQGAG